MRKKPEDQQVEFLRNLVDVNVRSIVEHEELVRIETDVTPGRVVFSIFVASSDVGLVLGDRGATTEALRRIVWTACKKTDRKCDIDVITNGRRP